MIDLAEMAGLRLDPWQQYVLIHALGQHSDGSPTASKVSVWVPRQNGKGAIIEALELYWLFVVREELIVHTAHEHNTSAKAYARLERILRRTPMLHRQVRQYRQANGQRQIELHNGQILQYATRSATAARGFSSPKLILDEAQELDAADMAAILPTVSAMENWQVWFFGTPPRTPDAWCYGLREDGESSAKRLAHFDWGADLDPTKAVDRQRALDRDLWYACNPALGIRILEDTVEDESRPSGLGDQFAAERLGAWLPQQDGGAVLDPKRWAEMVDSASHRGDGEQLALAVDVTPLRDHASIGMYTMRADGREHMQLIDYREGTEWLVDRLVELRETLDPICVAYDAKNGAHALLPDLAEHGIVRPTDRPEWDQDPKRGDLLELDTAKAVDAVGQFIDGFRAVPISVDGRPVPRYAHLGQAPLDTAVRGAVARSVGDAGQIAWGRRASEVDIGPLQVITEARYGYWLWKDVVRADYDVLDSVF